MSSLSKLKLITSQDLNYILDEEPLITNFDNVDILEEDAVIPEQYNDVPSNEDYPGPFNFETFIDPNATRNCIYSAMLNQVFIISHSTFPIDFKWDSSNKKTDFFVRAMPLYSDAQHAYKPVMRCLQHVQATESSNKDIPPLTRCHVMRCIHDQARYEGGTTQHFSVVVPLGPIQVGMDTVRRMYQFVCKNFCPSGMNRRPIEVVFTLEDSSGNIFGRNKVNVRICSSPKRDREKAEIEYMKTHNGNPPRGKKRKLNNSRRPMSFTEVNDISNYNVNLNIAGKHNYKAVIKYAQDLMAAEMVRHKTDEPFKSYYNEIGSLMEPHE